MGLDVQLDFVRCGDVVARDGIEPPTPAFSGPRSTTELSGLGESKDAASAYVVSESAASGGGPGQVSNCAQATNVSIAITSLCANFALASCELEPRHIVHWTLTPISYGACGVGEPHAAFLKESRTRSHGMEPRTGHQGRSSQFEYTGCLCSLCPDTALQLAGPSVSAASTLLLCLAPAAIAQPQAVAQNGEARAAQAFERARQQGPLALYAFLSRHAQGRRSAHSPGGRRVRGKLHPRGCGRQSLCQLQDAHAL